MGRVESGWARFGLPGLALGIGHRVGDGFSRGAGRGAAGPSGSARPRRPGAGGHGRPEVTKSQSARTVAANDPGGTLALIAQSHRRGPVALSRRYKQKSFAIYRIDPTNPKGSVKLEASRKYRWDLELDEYNNQGLGAVRRGGAGPDPDSYDPVERGDRRRDGSGSSLHES